MTRNAQKVLVTTYFLSAGIAAAIACATAIGAVERQAAPNGAHVDAVFSRWTRSTPGCAVAVSQKGRTVLERAFGLADLEHDVVNELDTIFEAGSVSKQFTAAAVMLLARDGKLSLDDPARKYLPELPDYGAPLTLRHMLSHTSGLRDWGSLAAIGGWPRTTRVHTHAHVLEIVSRQRSLNFPSGTRWSYSNTGYNLAAIIVSRVSGQSFAQFTRARIFEPLGMSRTSWRDDHTRIVKDRAIAYAEGKTGFSMDMPFENVHGNGGLLTTVGDLLRWARNSSAPVVGDAAFVREAQEPGRFGDGRAHNYGMGLRIATHRGIREIGHSGATAGYRAYLGDYPDRHVAVAVLCNVGSANAEQYAHAVADGYLGLQPAATITAENGGARDPVVEPAGAAGDDPLAGSYRRTDTGEPISVSRAGKDLRLDGDTVLTSRSATQFARSNGQVYDFVADGGLTVTDQFGRVDTYTRLRAEDLAARPFAEYVGAYMSAEADVTMTVSAESWGLELESKPDSSRRLTPVYADAFRSALGFIRFHRNAAGRVTGFSLSQDRVWDLRFERQ
jgi:CubicO group peptidase (beta-lactamase class C family)